MNTVTVVITKHGEDDYDVYYPECDCSVRGTLDEVMADIHDCVEVL